MRMIRKRLTALLMTACLLPVTVFAEAPTETPGTTPATTVQAATPEPVTTQMASSGPTPTGTEPTPTPAAGTPVPDTGTPTLAPDSPTPTPDSPTSATDSPTPTSDSPTPTSDSPTPTSDSPTPATGVPTPAPDSPTPTPDSPTSAPDSPTPTPDSPTPTPDSPTPTPDSPTPATGSPTPTTAPDTTPAPLEDPAWLWDGEQKHPGGLEELLGIAEAGDVIYIASDELFILTGEAAQQAKEAEFALDPEAFPEEEAYILYISDIGPDGEMQEGTLYIWAGKEEDAPPTPTPSTEPEPTGPVEIEAELLVVPEMYRAGAWSSTVPSFTLTVVPDTLTGYTFAVSVDGGSMQAVESPYAFATEGQHTLRFALIDANGGEAARSTTYTVWLDTAAPETQAQFDMQTGTLTVTATDAASGVDGISLDGGKTWQPMTTADGTSTYTTALTLQVAAGDLIVRDAAGNLWQSTEGYGMPGGMGGSFGGGSFSGGSSGTTRTVSHSSGSEEEATPYGAVTLEVEDTGMFILTVGGVELPLTLTLDYAASGLEGIGAAFTAELAVWDSGTPEADGEGDSEGADTAEAFDTLILTAPTDVAETPYAYRWDFSGDVYKTLFNSGVQYLVLRVGERVTALSTAGFTAGTAYNALKSAGAASSEFHYSLWMGEPDPEMELEVEARDTRYLLEAGEGDMYYYDVYTGDMDMLTAAFGAAVQEEQ